MNVLNRVAKGVGGVAKGMGEAVFGEGRHSFAAVPEDDAEVEGLLQRISDAISPEYRREAMAQLKDVLVDNPKAQLAMGTMGIPVLMNVLRDDRDDLEILRGALEVLVLAASGSPTAGDQDTPEAQAGPMNAELLARTPNHIALLLSLFEDEPVGSSDFYVQYYTLQLLNAVLASSLDPLAAAVLNCPMGVVRLQDMLNQREVIRNEALLLLGGLCSSSTEIAKILSFGGAVDVLLGVVREEEGLGGGVVVQDCLTLLGHLLRRNLATQLLFREMGQLPQLLALVAAAVAPSAPAGGMEDHGYPPPLPPPPPLLEFSRQKASNVIAALDTLALLVSLPHSVHPDTRNAEAANRLPNQVKLVAAGCLEVLLSLAFAPHPHDVTNAQREVAAAAMQLIGDIVADNPGGQEQLLSSVARVASGPPVPALQAALRVVLGSTHAQERAAAEHMLKGFIQANPDGQTTLAATIAPMAANDPAQQTFGSELASALARGGSGAGGQAVCARAAGVLTLLLSGNAAAKERALVLPLEALPSSNASQAAASRFLLPRVVRVMEEGLHGSHSASDAGRSAAAAMLRLLAVWVWQCPPAIAALTEHPMQLATLVDVIQDRGHAVGPLLAGLAAVVLAECVLHGHSCATPRAPTTGPAPSPPLPPSQIVFDVLVHRVGLATFFMRLEDLKRTPQFTLALSPPPASTPLPRVPRDGSSTTSTNAAAAAARGSDGGAAYALVLDHSFTQLVVEVESAIKKEALELFSKPTNHAHSASSEGLPDVSAPSTIEEANARANESIKKMEAEVRDLRARNRALAEDLLRVASGAQAGSSGGGAAVGGSSASELQERVAAEMRAARAERELAAAQQQAEQSKQRMSELEKEAASARAAAAAQEEAARRAEAELSSLSSAYNALESHAFSVEARLRDVSAAAPTPSAPAGLSEEKVQEAVAAAVEAACATLSAENDEAMTDLLVCLGQEESKVKVLGDRLRELGEDVETLLASIAEGGDDEDEEPEQE